MSLSVGIPKELKTGEKRVSLTPRGVKFLHIQSITVYVEKDAGLLSGFSDQEYEEAGAVIVPNSEALWKKAQLIKKVKEPIAKEFPFFSPQHVIFTFLHLAAPSEKPLIAALQKSKTTAIAYETIEKNGEVPLLKPMSEVAGTLAAYYGAIFQTHIRFAEGTIKGLQEAKFAMLEAASHYPDVPVFRYRGKVFILGGGHVGARAAQMAIQMGGEVWISEISEPRRKQLSALGAHVIDPNHEAEYQKILNDADVIIGAVHSAGKRAPIMINEELLVQISRTKKRIILDISIDQGGNIVQSKPCDYEELLYLDSFGNLRFSVTNIPSFCGRGASLALEAASLEYTASLARGFETAVRQFPELRSGINLLRGEVVLDAIR